MTKATGNLPHTIAVVLGLVARTHTVTREQP